MRVIRKHIVIVGAAFRVHRVLSDTNLGFLDGAIVWLLLIRGLWVVVGPVRLVALEAAADVHLLVVLKDLGLA